MAKMVTLDEYRRQIANGMSEETLRLKIKGLAKELGWMTYHTHDSRKSDAGWPDMVFAHPIRGRFLIRELKDQRRKVTTEQADWLHALTMAGVNAGVWRPMDFVDETVLRELLA